MYRLLQAFLLLGVALTVRVTETPTDGQLTPQISDETTKLVKEAEINEVQEDIKKVTDEPSSVENKESSGEPETEDMVDLLKFFSPSVKHALMNVPMSAPLLVRSPLNIVFVGPPGVGKGTYAAVLTKIFGIPHISTGDMIREMSKHDEEIQRLQSTGSLISDEVMTRITKERLAQADCGKGYLLDGYPRTVEQAKELAQFSKISLVLNLTLPDDIIRKKLTGRRLCSDAKCGNSYNVEAIDETIDGVHYYMPPLLPPKANTCSCGAVLKIRADDNAKVINDRLHTYHTKTKPVISFFTQKGLLREFLPSQGLQDLYALVENIVLSTQEIAVLGDKTTTDGSAAAA